jgi:PAS domain S-box-containing protein
VAARAANHHAGGNMIGQNDEAAQMTEGERLMSVIRGINEERTRLARAVHLAGLGYWEWDLALDRIAASDELCRIFGLDMGDLDGAYAAYLARVHADDRAGTDRVLRSAAGAQHGQVFHHHHRVLLQDGTLRTLRLHGEVLWDGASHPARVFTACADVTEEMRAHRELEAAAALQRAAAELRDRAAQRAMLLARASRLLALRDFAPAQEACVRSALPMLGEVAAVDRLTAGRAERVSYVFISTELKLEPPEELAALSSAEVRDRSSYSRLAVPIAVDTARLGTLTFATVRPRRHSGDDVALAQELADRIALAMQNADDRQLATNAVSEREQLLYVAAHELRTPLTSLRLCVEALRRNGTVAPEGGRHLDIIDRDERRLARLVDDLLDLARIRSGQLQLHLEPVDLRDLVGDVARRLTLEIARSGCPVIIDEGPPVVGNWDRSRLEQIVTNLLTNAMKFGESKPINISVSADERRALLVVSDRGLGIPHAHQRRIFEAFERAADLRRFGGLGLGLHIVRTIADSMGSEVRVTSEPGMGATFTVELPLAPPAAPPVAADADR